VPPAVCPSATGPSQESATTGQCSRNRTHVTTEQGCLIIYVVVVVGVVLITMSVVFFVLLRHNPRWGAANIPYSRWLPAEYEDVWGMPRGWDPEHTYHNASLPPVRVAQQPAAGLWPVACRHVNPPLVSRCGWCLRRCCSLTMTTSLWTPLSPTCWWNGVSGSTTTWC